MNEQSLAPSSEFERYGDFNPEKIAAVFGTKPRLAHFEIRRNPKTREITQRIPVYEIDVVGPTTFESVALLLKPDTRTVHAQAFSRPANSAAGGDLIMVAGLINETTFPTDQAYLERRVDRIDIHISPITDSEQTQVKFISEDDNYLTELIVAKAGSFTFACYSKKDMHPLEIEPLS